ncbi:MAG: membrane protein insertion efficiency factor YidD [Gammaproteobacteria bacterium]|nr:membrane protein insertion efficiency factor YidD [Gammaproteobacteria bacterium]
MGKNNTASINCVCFVIQAYRYLIKPVLPSCCRFYPSCSDYAIQSLSKHGLAKGGWLLVCRLLRCHPWHLGGHDPVPE